jgi:ribosomal-protein-alanine N-acetyltransferase
MMTQTRLIEVDDADELCETLNANRSFLAPWEPEYPSDFLTPDGQRISIAAALRARDAGQLVPHVVTLNGEIIGRITLSNIVRAAFQSCNLGYWIAEAHNGRGHATEAVGQMCAVAFDELGLHRVEAGTLRHNGGSPVSGRITFCFSASTRSRDLPERPAARSPSTGGLRRSSVLR